MRNWLSWLGWNRSAPQLDVVLYTRVGCHLCDDAKVILQRCLPQCPIVEVDIDTDPELRQRYDFEVPVVQIDGQVRFRGRINEVLLRRLIRHG